MRAGLLVAVLLALMVPLAGYSQSTDLPQFDIKAHCTKLSANRDTMLPRFMKACEASEEEDRRYLEAGWPGYAAEVRSYCIKVATYPDRTASYSLLRGCIAERLG